MTAHGTLKADAIAVAHVAIDTTSSPKTIKIRIGIVHTPTGATLGWMDAETSALSDETVQQVHELCEAIERDVARQVFVEEAVQATDPSSASVAPAVGGIGEHLAAEGDAPSV